MSDSLKQIHIHHLADYLHSHCSRAQSDRLEDLQQRSLLLQTDQGTALRRISEELNNLQYSLQSVIEAKSSQHQQRCLTTSDVDHLHEKLQSLSLSTVDLTRQQAILQSLTFESRPVRHTQIAMAHATTFRWAFRTDRDPTLGPSIGAWLDQGHGIFWVSGKPGSGKSTLMKYIADSSVTSQLIAEWARPYRAIIVSHYFWIAGTAMQKSQQGLLQSLLYDIFRQCPDLIERTCMERWNSSEPAGRWSLTELNEALQTFAATSQASLKLCLIIDGLDEFSGDHEDRTQLCRKLKVLAASGNIKLCLSSRPWNIFEEELGFEFPKVYMQDLTRDDIERYTSSRLGEHTRWAAVSANHSQGQWLILEIVAKSNGVFFWVFLVTKLLREGLTNRDTFVDLRRRLESFPSELEPFFKAMLEAVEPYYHSHMSTALQIANSSRASQLSFLVYSFHFQEYEDSDYAINLPIKIMDDDEIAEIRSNTSWHLDSRTRGLLEVNPQDGTVTFIHRTVRDFLKTREIHDFLIAKADSRLKFSPSLSILKAFIAMIKTSPIPNPIARIEFGEFDSVTKNGDIRQNNMLKLIEKALIYAKEMEIYMAGEVRQLDLLDELDRSLSSMLSGERCTSNIRSWSKMRQAFFREQLVQQGLFDYLNSKMNSDPAFLEDIGAVPVLRFFSPYPIITRNIQLHRGRGTDLLISLLDNGGINTNKDELPRLSPWQQLFEHLCHWWTWERKSATRFLSLLFQEGILKRFLKAGADPSALVEGPRPLGSSSEKRAATIVYLDFCFDVLSQSPPIQALYLDVLSEFLQLSSDEVLKSAAENFCAGLSNKYMGRLHWELLFFAKVTNILRVALSSREPVTTEILRVLDQTGNRVFPSKLYMPPTVAREPRGRKRKQCSSSGRRRKTKRET